MKKLLLALAMLFSPFSIAADDQDSAVSGIFSIPPGSSRESSRLPVFFHKPAELREDAPVLLVIPGAGRNAWDYRDAWEQASEKYGVLVLAPHYCEAYYPEFWNYNLARMISDVKINATRNGLESFRIVRDSNEWIFGDFDRIFAHAVEKFGLTTRTYDMFGHSAGGQIVHRFALFAGKTRANRLVAANSGWYTLPDFDEAFPYGLLNSTSNRKELKQAFRKNLTVFLGELDNEHETRGHLARNEELDRQGAGRLSRGKYFFDQAARVAGQSGTEFNWKLKIVPGVGHEYRRMSEHAANLLYE